MLIFFFFFNDTATTEIYTLSLHDALPISTRSRLSASRSSANDAVSVTLSASTWRTSRSEEHTSELQSPDHLVCRLLLEKKKITWFHVLGAYRCSWFRDGLQSLGLFFFNDTATTEIYTLSLHDALPIPTWRTSSARRSSWPARCSPASARRCSRPPA